MFSGNPLTRRHGWLVDIVSLTFIILIFYFLWLGSYPFFTPDEGRYSEVAREMLLSGDYITPRVNGVAFLDKPILHYWLQATALNLFGVNEWAVRFFPALLGVLGCLVSYICGRILFNRRAGILSAIILATSPLYFGGAHYANMDLEIATFVSCTLLFFITGLNMEGKWRFIFLLAMYVSAAFAFLTKGLIALAFPVLIIGTWLTLLSRWDILKRIHLILGTLLLIAITLPWQLMIQETIPDFFHYFFITQQVTRFLSAAVFNNHEPIWFFIPVVLFGFFPWTIFIVQAFYHNIKMIVKDRQQHQKELFLLLWVSIIFVFFSIPHSKITTYILPIFPALALIVGSYLSTLWENAQQKSIHWAAFNFIGISLIFTFSAMVVTHHKMVEFTPQFIPFLYFIVFVFIIGAFTSLYFINKQTLRAFFTVCTVSSAAILLTFTVSAEYLNARTTKSLITDLKTIIQPSDEVINYYRYFYDVPLYLQKRVKIVANWDAPNIEGTDNSTREFSRGKPYQNTENLLINETHFWELWNSPQRVFVFMNLNAFNRFKQQASSYFFIGKENDIVLLSNKLTRLTKIRDTKAILALLERHSFEHP